MPKKPKSFYRNSNSRLFLLAAILIAAVSLPACADDRSLIDETLDARETFLNKLDIEAYLGLFSPDYRPAQTETDYRQVLQDRFKNCGAVTYQSYSRTVQIDEDVARVVQDYRISVTGNTGKTISHKGRDHFLLKRHGFGPFAQWLFYEGLDGPARRPQPFSATATPPVELPTGDTAGGTD